MSSLPVKRVALTVKREQVCPGVWRETLSNGERVMVADLTSALWRYVPERRAKVRKSKRRAR